MADEEVFFFICHILNDTGYPHDSRADKNPYPHDRRTDKDSYQHDSKNQCITPKFTAILRDD